MKINKFKEYIQNLDEASLEGNPGIPGEGGKPGRYLKEKDYTGMRILRSIIKEYGAGFDVPQVLQRIIQLQTPHEKELEKLAYDTIMRQDMYGSILADVNLIVKFLKPEKIKMEFGDDTPEIPALEELKDKELISEIQKRKIINNITQGEGKNAKKCLNLPFVTDGLNKIMGDDNAKEYLELLNKISDLGYINDWTNPIPVSAKMWKEDNKLAGMTKVEWKPKEKKEEEDKEEDKEKEFNIDDLLNKLDEPEEEDLGDSPTIHALGTDFSMLFHEAIKGIYALILQASIPEDEETAKIVIMNTRSFADEVEDLRYGPFIAADLRNLINKFSEVDEIDNLREHVAGKLAVMPADKFLEFMFLLLSEDKKAERIMKGIVKEIKDEFDEYEKARVKHELGEDDDDEEESEFGELDYSKMSQKELNDELNKALDADKFDLATEISGYIKESEIILKEIEIYKNLNEAAKNLEFDKVSEHYSDLAVIKPMIEEKVVLLLETVKLAKELLLKDFAEKRKKKVADLNDSETKFALNNKKFEQIKELLGKVDKNGLYQTTEPALLYAFTKFYCIENAGFSMIEDIYDLIKKYKDMLPQLPLGSVAAYMKDVDKETDHRPGYERLRDDLVKLEEKRKIKRFINDMKKEMREEYKRLDSSDNENDKKLITKFNNSVLLLYTLPDIKATDENGHTKIRNAYKEQEIQARKYIDVGNHPTYADKRVAFSSMVNNMESKIDSWGKGQNEIYGDALELGAEIGILYYEGAIIATSARTPDASNLFCGDTAYCITDPEMFYNYSRGGNIIVNILNFNKSKADDDQLISLTIREDGKIHEMQNRTNDFEVFNKYKNVLWYKALEKEKERLGYPQELIDDIKIRFKEEVQIKKVVQKLYKNISRINPTDFIDDVLDLKKVYAKSNNPGQFEEITRIATEILLKSGDLGSREFFDYYLINGVINFSALAVFQVVMQDSCTHEQLDQIISITIEEFDAIEELASELLTVDEEELKNKQKTQAEIVDEIEIELDKSGMKLVDVLKDKDKLLEALEKLKVVKKK